MKKDGERTLAEHLAEYAFDLTPDRGVMQRALLSLKDSIGCMMAGMKEEATITARRYVSGRTGSAEAHAVGLRDKTDAGYAALINGVAINAHDFDDISVAMNGHPSAVILPVAMACAELLRTDGNAFLNAYIAGVETASLFGRGVCPESFRRGWHCTSVIGILGATVAAGRLFGLTKQELASALCLAASEASGVKANLGALAKPFHCGRAAQKAIETVLLTRCGCTANLSALDAPDGLACLIAGQLHTEPIYKALQNGVSVFCEPGIGLKPYPSCKCTFNGIDAMTEIMKKHRKTADEIASVSCVLQTAAFENLRYHAPQTSLQKKLSMEYCLAMAAIEGTVTLAQFASDAPPESTVQQLMNRIQVMQSNALEMFAEDTAEVTVTFRDGTSAAMRVEYAAGSPEKPMTEASVLEKFLNCCAQNLSKADAQELWDELDAIRSVPDCCLFFEKLFALPWKREVRYDV